MVHCDHKGPSKREAGDHSESRNIRMEQRSGKTEVALRLALKVEERAASQGCGRPVGHRRDEEVGTAPLDSPEGTQCCLHLDLGPARPILNF